MKIIISGSSGLVGSELVPYLENEGHSVTRLVRDETSKSGIFWDPQNRILEPSHVEGFDAVINLSGEGIANGKWNEKKKKRILESRVNATDLLASVMASLDHPPKVFLNASAVGYYGNVSEGTVSESNPPGNGFLAEVCQAWEAATEPLLGLGTRIVLPRIGVVLSKKGGALAKMLTPFKLGLGGIVGTGVQEMSWIAIDDLLRVFSHCLQDESIHGPINAVAPNPVTNYEFTKTLGKVLKRPTIFPMPTFLVKLAFGEMGEELLLSGAEVHPVKLLKTNFTFTYPHLEEALRHIL